MSPNLDIPGYSFAVFVHFWGGDCDYLAFLGSFLGGIGNNDATLADFFPFYRFDYYAVSQRL
jgi:hypothetical protein